jgi:hypothetical protein
MKTWVAVLITMLLACSTPAHADGVFLESGPGFYKSTDSQALFLSYQIDSPPLFGLNGYYDVALGSWNGPNRDKALVLAKGILMNLSGTSYISLEPGGAYLERTTANLGTRLQFAFRSALGLRTGKYDISIGYKHFSNGKGIFRWTEKANFSENFITLQVGCLL